MLLQLHTMRRAASLLARRGVATGATPKQAPQIGSAQVGVMDRLRGGAALAVKPGRFDDGVQEFVGAVGALLRAGFGGAAFWQRLGSTLRASSREGGTLRSLAAVFPIIGIPLVYKQHQEVQAQREEIGHVKFSRIQFGVQAEKAQRTVERQSKAIGIQEKKTTEQETQIESLQTKIAELEALNDLQAGQVRSLVAQVTELDAVSRGKDHLVATQKVRIESMSKDLEELEEKVRRNPGTGVYKF